MIEKLLALAPHHITDEKQVGKLLKWLRTFENFPAMRPPNQWTYYVTFEVIKIWEEMSDRERFLVYHYAKLLAEQYAENNSQIG